MIGNKKRTYEGKCGSCIFFAFRLSKHGDTREHGVCSQKNRVNYHQASQNACKLYVIDEGG